MSPEEEDLKEIEREIIDSFEPAPLPLFDQITQNAVKQIQDAEDQFFRDVISKMDL